MKASPTLRGGAICSIATIEREKQQCRIARLRKAFDRKIYAIVADLRDDPFQRIPVPECAREFITQQNETNHHFSRIPEMEAFRPISSDRIDELLDVLDNRLRNRRSGAWQTLNSDNPDRLSQAANSMVELLDQVIGQVCGSVTLNEFLERKFGGREETRWVHATRNWISETKSNLHRIKHHTDFQSEKLTEALMRSAESIIFLILE